MPDSAPELRQVCELFGFQEPPACQVSSNGFGIVFRGREQPGFPEPMEPDDDEASLEMYRQKLEEALEAQRTHDTKPQDSYSNVGVPKPFDRRNAPAKLPFGLNLWFDGKAFLDAHISCVDY